MDKTKNTWNRTYKFIHRLVETDKIWDNELTLNNIIAQWPVINKVEVSQVCTKITKVKCQRTTITLNSKAKRAPHNKIKVSVQTI